MEQSEGILQLKTCRVERLFPLNDWETTWKRCRLPSLGPNLSSFLFLVVHELLPTQARLSKADPSLNGICRMCTENVIDDLQHSLIQCDFNYGIGKKIIQCASQSKAQTHLSIMKLNFITQQDNVLPVLLILAIVWKEIWEKRKIFQRPELFTIRAKLEAQISILRETRRLQDEAVKLESLIQSL